MSVCVQAAAKCPIIAPQFYVGDTTGDVSCDYNDIQSAIDAVGTCPVVVNVTREHTWTSQHLAIVGKALVLQAWGDGVTCDSLKNFCPISGCLQTSTQPLVTIDGSGSATGAVLSIAGASSVTLNNLTITGGGQVSADGALFNGGGISFDGNGALTLNASTVSNNFAGFGGGIYINGSSGALTLTLGANALVISNTAQYSGGGIRVQGTSSLVAAQALTLIGFNTALGTNFGGSSPVEGYGGGVEVVGPARADIGSPGYNGLGVLYNNTASYGGGIAVFAGDQPIRGTANFYAADPQHPVTLDGNFASSQGGAIFARGFSQYLPEVLNTASVCLSNYRIVHNAAPDGAVAYLDWDTNVELVAMGAKLLLNSGTCGGPAGATCASGTPCNQAYDNLSQDVAANPTDGSVIFVGKTSALVADKLDLRGSSGAHLVYDLGDNYTNYAGDSLLRSCLLADNTVSQELIAGFGSSLTLDNCTIAGNSIGGSHVANTLANLTNSLVFQPGLPTAAYAATYVLANDISQLPAGVTVKMLADPKFVDTGSGDYHLQLSSPAVDYAGGLGGTDLEG
ncbi:MAG TPA: hypothetical protein VLB69_07740, partial [Rudaea sp.]|nr:hypothetical protein [Rudaea sp.]